MDFTLYYVFCVLLSAVYVYCDPVTNVPCTNQQQDDERNQLVEKERCGSPKQVYVELNRTVPDEIIHPRAVWVRRCIGYCDHLGPQVKCKPSIIEYLSVPVRVYNKNSQQDRCEMYKIEDHPQCQACQPVLDPKPCEPESEAARHELFTQAQCDYPKEVFFELTHEHAHKDIIPKGVWIKQCVGLCDQAGPGTKCMPRLKSTRKIPVLVSNLKTNKESCAVYEVEEHEQCGGCGAP